VQFFGLNWSSPGRTLVEEATMSSIIAERAGNAPSADSDYLQYEVRRLARRVSDLESKLSRLETKQWCDHSGEGDARRLTTIAFMNITIFLAMAVLGLYV
jgi:hypothetical protein